MLKTWKVMKVILKVLLKTMNKFENLRINIFYFIKFYFGYKIFLK